MVFEDVPRRMPPTGQSNDTKHGSLSVIDDSNASVGSRNGYTGEVFLPAPQRDPTVPEPERPRTRVRRTRLQSALLARVPPGVIRYNKKLLSLQDLEGKGVHLAFLDGTEAVVDLVVGADGFRSVCFHPWASAVTLETS